MRKSLTDLHESFRERRQWANEQMIKFWWRFGSRIRIRIRMRVRRGLAEVCTVHRASRRVCVLVVLVYGRTRCK